MKSINFKSVVKKTYAINGDEGNTITINVLDAGLVGRMERLEKDLQSIVDEVSGKALTAGQILDEYDRKVREIIDYALGQGVSQAAFGSVNCMSLNEDSKRIFIAFWEAFIPLLVEDINNAKMTESVNHNISDKAKAFVENKPFIPLNSPAIDTSALTPEQKAELIKELLK